MKRSAQTLMGFFFARADSCGLIALDQITLDDAHAFGLPTVVTSSGEIVDHCSIAHGLQDLRSRRMIHQTHLGYVSVRFPEQGLVHE